MAKKDRNARGCFVGGYLDPEQKRRLLVLAEVRQKSVTELLSEMVDQATAGVAHFELSATNNQRAQHAQI